jgi:hypothetical protein
MKKSLLLIIAFTGGLGLATIVARLIDARRETQANEAIATLENESTALKAALARARAGQSGAMPSPLSQSKNPSKNAQTPQQVLDKLAKLTVDPSRPRSQRPVLALLEQLTDAKSAAQPPIVDFLKTGQDVVYATTNKPPRDLKQLADALMPYSLRFALFDVLRQIGGEASEAALVAALSASQAGLELAFLTEIVEEMAPGKHRNAALEAAKKLLASATGTERDFFLGILKRFGDTSYVGTAEAQLVQADGSVDRGALRYLQQTLGPQSVDLVARLYEDSRVNTADGKESLARVALAYVGTSGPALQLFHKAVLDQTLLPDQKRNLIEDLNEDGIINRKTLTPTDLEVVANRYAITQEYLRQDYVTQNQTLNAAFLEADKDLRKMLEKATAAPAPTTR